MKLVLRNKVIWAQTFNGRACAKLITFPTFCMALHAIRWCGTFNSGEKAGLALIDYCNEKGLKPDHSPISTSFGELAGKKANFHL